MGDESTADVLYGVKAIAAFLELPARAAQHRIDQGVIPTFRIGTTICSRRSTLNTWLAECEAKARTDAAPKA